MIWAMSILAALAVGVIVGHAHGFMSARWVEEELSRIRLDREVNR